MNDTASPFQDFTELAGQVSYSSQRFQSKVVLDRDGFKAIVFAFKQGQQLKEHQATHEVLLVMLEGECAFTIYQAERPLRAGQVYRIPAHVPHAVQAITDFKMVLIK